MTYMKIVQYIIWDIHIYVKKEHAKIDQFCSSGAPGSQATSLMFLTLYSHWHHSDITVISCRGLQQHEILHRHHQNDQIIRVMTIDIIYLTSDDIYAISRCVSVDAADVFALVNTSTICFLVIFSTTSSASFQSCP